MKGMIWNSEGFGDPAKHFRVQEIIIEQKLDFLALVETRRSDFVAPFLKGLAGGLDYIWYCLPPHRFWRYFSWFASAQADSLQRMA